MNKSLIVGLAVISAVLLVSATYASAVTIYNEWSGVLDCTYLIFKIGTTTYAKSCDDGSILTSGTDSDAVIQASIDDMTSGGMLFMKGGEYDIDTQMNLKSYISIIGEGNSTLLQAGTNINTFFKTAGSGTTVTGVLLSNFAVDGANTANNFIGISVNDHFNNSTISHVTYRNFVQHGIIIGGAPTAQVDSNQLIITNVGCYNVGRYCITLYGVSNAIIANSMLTQGQPAAISEFGGIDVDQYSNSITITGNTFLGGEYGAKITYVAGKEVSDVTITGNTFQQHEYGVYATGNRIVVTGNIFESSVDNGINSYPGAQTKPIFQGIVISSNVFKGQSRDGIGLNFVYDAVVANNVVLDYGRYGIVLDATNHTLVVGNRVSSSEASTRQFIETVDNGVSPDYNMLVNNDLTSPVSTITIVGSNTVIRDNLGYKTEAEGTGSIDNGATSDVITHGLAYTPSAAECTVTFTENPTNTTGVTWISSISSTQFTVNVENDPGASNLDFSWACRRI